MNRSHIARILEILLGLVLLWAGFIKLLDPAAFADALEQYHLFPMALVPWVALLVPALEVVVGLSLVFRRYPSGARGLALALFLAFWGAVVQAVLRGIDVSCGCFGAAAWDRTNLRKVLENTLLLLTSLYVWWFGEHHNGR